jgi:hypothetical protein
MKAVAELRLIIDGISYLSFFASIIVGAVCSPDITNKEATVITQYHLNIVQ